MNTSKILATLVSAYSLFFSATIGAQVVGGFFSPFSSSAAASTISEAAIVEMPLDGTGAFQMTWAGIAQYGHGPVQLVIELPRSNKWLGTTCLKFITMHRSGNAYVSVTGGYVFTYESRRAAASGSYSDRPDREQFSQFERSLKIEKEDSIWQASANMQGNQRYMRWTDENGQLQIRQDVVSAMKPLQNIPHCSI